MVKLITGNEAVALAVKLARTQVIAAYPITPQTTIVEKLIEFITTKQMDAEFIPVESEHSAMSCCVGSRCRTRSSSGTTSFTSI